MDERTPTEFRGTNTPSALQVCPDFIEKLPVAICACDMQGRIVWFNVRAVALWGRVPRSDDDVDCLFDAYWFEGRRISPAERPISEVLKTGIPLHGIKGMIERSDGSRIWTMAYIEPVSDENGSIVGAINCFCETTGTSFEAQTLEDLFENAIMPLHLVAADGTILRANAKELQMLGYLPAEYIGRHIAEFHVDQAVAQEMLERLSHNEQLVQFPARMRARDGSIRHVLVSSNARFREGEFVNTRCFTVDVTERLLAEERSRWQEKQRLDATYQHVPIGIVEVDENGRILRANAQSYGLFGYSWDEMLGRSIFAESITQSDSADHEQFRRQVAGELDRYTIEERIRRKDGSCVWVLITSSSVRDTDGRFLYAVRVQQDITERKEREEKERLVAREVNHRAKNILSVVDAIAHQTVAKDPEHFVECFSERIRALAANQDLLVRNEWRGVEIEDMVRAQLSHFADLIGSRIAMNGPKLRLNATGAQAVGLALHELATNAGKYGALSTDCGRVDIGWGAEGDNFIMSWAEREGPPVRPPRRRGFGTIVMETMTERSVNGAVNLDYSSSGVTWRLTCPAAKALEPRERHSEAQKQVRSRTNGAGSAKSKR